MAVQCSTESCISYLHDVLLWLDANAMLSSGIRSLSATSLSSSTIPLLFSLCVLAVAPMKVSIIGAGTAGLGCARKLEEFGIEAIIYEARNRIGGRVSRAGPLSGSLC